MPKRNRPAKIGRGSSGRAEPVFPGKTWAKKTPANVDLDAAKLKAFSQFVGGRGCVVRHGYMVYSWGDVARRADVASACKPFYSHFLWKAIEDGKIKSVDEKVLKWEPRLRRINKSLGFPQAEWYAHVDGDSWDYVVIAPKLSDEQEEQADADARKRGLSTGFAAGLELRHFIRSHTDTISVGPVTPSSLVAAAQGGSP